MTLPITLPQGMEITGDIKPGYEAILTSEALNLVAKLTREFEARRQDLLAVRVERAKRLDAGDVFISTHIADRRANLTAAPAPAPEAAVDIFISTHIADRRAIWRHGGETMRERVRNKIALSGGGMWRRVRATIAALTAMVAAV